MFKLLGILRHYILLLLRLSLASVMSDKSVNSRKSSTVCSPKSRQTSFNYDFDNLTISYLTLEALSKYKILNLLCTYVRLLIPSYVNNNSRRIQKKSSKLFFILTLICLLSNSCLKKIFSIILFLIDCYLLLYYFLKLPGSYNLFRF